MERDLRVARLSPVGVPGAARARAAATAAGMRIGVRNPVKLNGRSVNRAQPTAGQEAQECTSRQALCVFVCGRGASAPVMSCPNDQRRPISEQDVRKTAMGMRLAFMSDSLGSSGRDIETKYRVQPLNRKRVSLCVTASQLSLPLHSFV